MRGRKLPDQKEHKADNAQNEQQQDKVRSEPVFLLALVQHYLKAADAERKKTNAPVVNAAFAALDVRRILDEQGDHRDRRDAHRNVDVEQPAPAIAVSDPAAQDGA